MNLIVASGYDTVWSFSDLVVSGQILLRVAERPLTPGTGLYMDPSREPTRRFLVCCINMGAFNEQKSTMILLLGHTDEPLETLRRQLQLFRDSSAARREFSFSYSLDAFWIHPASSIEIVALIKLEKRSGSTSIVAMISDGPELPYEISRDSTREFTGLKQALKLPSLELTSPLRLDTVGIDKPWGQEIWHTGIEPRGCCSVMGIPLPWILPLLENSDGTGSIGNLILLKILAPHAEPVFGDLYFELHEMKTEVYVVSGIDLDAWPDGTGYIRFGFDSDLLSNAHFENDYLSSVLAYRAIRQEIDDLIDEQRRSAGYSNSAVIPLREIKAWHTTLDRELIAEEHRRRLFMDSFTQLRPVRIGDVVSVPPLVPHALQHGVRTIEFQTPHYERKILSFAQKVLTQDHWDTESALALMRAMPIQDPSFEAILSEPGILVEKIVEFDQFSVLRIKLEPGCSCALTIDCYLLGITVSGDVSIDTVSLANEEAALIPVSNIPHILANQQMVAAIGLIAYPTCAGEIEVH